MPICVGVLIGAITATVLSWLAASVTVDLLCDEWDRAKRLDLSDAEKKFIAVLVTPAGVPLLVAILVGTAMTAIACGIASSIKSIAEGAASLRARLRRERPSVPVAKTIKDDLDR